MLSQNTQDLPGPTFEICSLSQNKKSQICQGSDPGAQLLSSQLWASVFRRDGLPEAQLENKTAGKF